MVEGGVWKMKIEVDDFVYGVIVGVAIALRCGIDTSQSKTNERKQGKRSVVRAKNSKK